MALGARDRIRELKRQCERASAGSPATPHHDERWQTIKVKFLSSLRHPHLLPLLAYCNHPALRALAFPLLPNASLDLWLHAHHHHPGQERPPLTITHRIRIAADVADALCFLHGQTPPVAHRDVSSSTVLLSGELRGHLGGLSLLKHVPGARMQRRLSHRKGYIDPEYFQSFKLVKESDIYSFGVVLLELLSALPPVVDGDVDAATGQVQKILLAQYATPYLQSGDLDHLVDPLLSSPRDRLAALAVIAQLCISASRFSRPTAAELAEWLADLAATPLESPLPDAVVRLIPAAFADLCQIEATA
ncbi:hypothetical protein CLOP_g6419 [Closterium sp. NIES-67]|nr:hypothetical protein CLOP_g6419 [Closterium sp. NIES-67]